MMNILNLFKEIIRYTLIIFGLTGFGIIVAEILKKWSFINRTLGIAWIIIPLLALFGCREYLNSSLIGHQSKISPFYKNRILKITDVLLVILSILMFISIPFIWYGTIEELAGH